MPDRESGASFQGLHYDSDVQFAQATHQLAPRSLWWLDLTQRAAPGRMEEWLVGEANARGYLGASGRQLPQRTPDARLCDEDLVVALLSPRAEVDARILKLVVRMLQSGRLDFTRLLLRARRENAIGPLFWLVNVIPAQERNAPISKLLGLLPAPPRGYREPDYRFDPQRLVRRVARKGDLWRTHRS
jgi:hypothetical protein